MVSKANPGHLKESFKVFLKENNFEEIIQVNNVNDKVRIYSFEKGENLKELLIEIENGSEMVLLKVQGDLKINDVENLTAFNDVK